MKNPLRKTKGYWAYQAKRIINRMRGASKNNDDNDWRLYHYLYREELSEIKKAHTLLLSPGDYAFENGTLALQRNVLPLHPNHRLLYETILQLGPERIYEAGCGGGDHLYNLGMLAPKIGLYGGDISNEQLLFLKQRHPDLKATISQIDITLPFSFLWPRVELCFTQAVIMHIHTGNGQSVALSNLFKISQRHVILMENWRAHNFMDLIRQLFEKKMIPWEKIYFYYRLSPELNKPHIMIISSVQLPYELLTKYEILLEK